MTAAHEMPHPTTQPAPDECWELFRSADFGRLGVVVESRPEIFPINYVVDRGTIVFRSAPGTKLDATLSGAAVVLEVDGFNARTNIAWSAVAKGSAERLSTIEEVPESSLLPLFP